MNILSYLKTGFFRALNIRKGVLIVWFSMFILVLVFIYPFRASLSSAFGRSLITEKLADGFDIEVFADLGTAFRSILSFFTAGFIIIYLIGFVINAFLTAGLFGSVRKDSGKFSSQEFFRAGSGNFWSFLIISLIITVIIGFLNILITIIPFIILNLSDSISEKSAFVIVVASITLCLMLLPVFFLAADYARAWKTAKETGSCFRAIGAGFKHTFSKFWRSYVMMTLLILAQIAFGILIILILPGWKPVTGGGVFLLLIISQLMLYLRLLLKTWRYASVTAMMEESNVIVQENQ